MSRRVGFTLLELLVVVAILATLAGGVVATMDGVEEEASSQLARHELATLREAVLAFRRDTGFLPKQGPFALAPAGVVPVPAEGAAWFASPANWSQLYENPLASTSHALRAWNPDARRGWNGPYLARGAEGRVAVPTFDAATFTWLAGPLLSPMPSVADPFARPQEATGAFAWTGWSGEPLDRHGRPYLLLRLDDLGEARIVSFGADGAYDGTAIGDDVAVFLR
jgi:prepilin-type N-terminal cleavage/methylation domain-containing protein